LIARLPDVALLWRLSVVREVILSGFQLELYSREEKSFAYWYAVEVIDAHLSCLDNLTSIVQEGAHSPHFSCFWFLYLMRPNTFLDTTAYREMVYQIQFLTALRSICAALFTVSLPSSFDWARIPPNFFRRYKWAFRSCYDNLETPVVASPELYRFIKACGESKKVKVLHRL
jgi:N-alpha-acetyltransferase 35, NatC auxiliary subunit